MKDRRLTFHPATIAHRALLVAGLLLLPALALPARTPRLYTQETEHVRVIYYSPAHEYLVAHLMRSFENALKFDSRVIRYQPSQKVTVLLEDFSDYGHGGAGTVPSNFVDVGLAPLNYIYETLPANERITWIMNHEMIHITMGDNASGLDRLFRRLFLGKVGPTPDDPVSMFYSSLTSPRHYSPRWFHEGIAAFLETWMSGGLGRALGGYDEMVFRAMVRDDAYMYNVVGLESEGSAIDFQVGANSYLYGTRFMTYLVQRHGPEKLLDWITRTDDSARYFATQFRKVYGKPLQDEWREWIAAEHQWQKVNLEAIRQYPVTRPRPVSAKELGSVSRSYYDADRKRVYTAVQYPGAMAHLAELDPASGAIRRLKDVRGASLYYVTSLAFDRAGRRIFFASDNKNWRDLNVLDLATGRSRRLLKDSRTGDLVFRAADQAVWGMRHVNGLSTLVRFAAPYVEPKPVKTFAYGTDFFDLDISPDGRSVTGALSDMSGRQKLVRFDVEKLLQGGGDPEVLHDFEYSSPANFVFSADGRFLYGTSYYTGASNIFRYDFQSKEMEVLSNSDTGLFRPLPLPHGTLIAFEYTAKGFVPGVVPTIPLKDVSAVKYLGQELVDKYPVFKSWKLPPPTSINLEAITTKAGHYSPVKNIRLISAYPIVQGYKNSGAGGLRMEFADPLRLAGVNLTATYSPSTALPLKERFHFGLNAHRWNWKLTSYYNNADFYDLFGPTKVGRKGYGVKLDHRTNLIFDTPRTLDLDWSVAQYGGLERLPDYQNVAASSRAFLTGKLALNYSYLERSLGAVEDGEKGVTWDVVSRINYAGSKGFPRIHGNYSRGILLPMRNSTLWLRGSAGKSFGDRNNPFANFFFGGFGNNYVDHQETSRYRQYYSFPGVELNQIGATSYAKALAEWNMSPIRFKSLGTTAMYVNWARVSLFSSGLFTNLGRASDRRTFANIGAQMDFRVVFFTYLNSTFSVGYAGATDRRGRTSSEFMISLKLL